MQNVEKALKTHWKEKNGTTWEMLGTASASPTRGKFKPHPPHNQLRFKDKSH